MDGVSGLLLALAVGCSADDVESEEEDSIVEEGEGFVQVAPAGEMEVVIPLLVEFAKVFSPHGFSVFDVVAI